MRLLVRGQNYRCQSIGMPQDTTISQVIVQFYLHQLDKIFQEVQYFDDESSQPVRVYYARYAGNIMLGIPKITTTCFLESRAKVHAFSILKKACDKFYLDLRPWSLDKLFILCGGLVLRARFAGSY